MRRIYWSLACLFMLAALLMTMVACDNGTPDAPIGAPDDPSVTPGDLAVKITVDENGLATWEHVDGAVTYEYTFTFDAGNGPTNYGVNYTPDTSVQIPEGYWLEVRPMFADGEFGHWSRTEIFGDVANRVEPDPDIPEWPSASDAPEKAVIHVGADGTATWDAVEGATYYRYAILYEDEFGNIVAACAEDVTAPATVPLQDGYFLEVLTYFANDNVSNAQTEVFGDASKRARFKYGPIHEQEYDVRWEELKAYELIGNIVTDSIVVAADGTVTFDAIGPKGETMRFYGRGVRVREGEITMMPGAFLTALDAVGRIMSYEVITDRQEDAGGFLISSGGYTFSDKTHVDSYQDLTYVTGWSGHAAGPLTAFVDDGKERVSSGVYTTMDILRCQPNFISLQHSAYFHESVSLYELHVYYDEVYTTDVEHVVLFTDFYSAYLVGETYDESREDSYLEPNVPALYLVVKPKVRGDLTPLDYEAFVEKPSDGLFTISPTLYRIGALHDADGKLLDKSKDALEKGTYLDITIGDQLCTLEVPVVDRYHGASVMNDLVPYAYPEALGTLNVLVVPIGWQDEPEHADEDEYARFCAELGRVMDETGKVTDYSLDAATEKRFSLSEYYDIASYGKLTVQSFMTDWYRAPYDFAEMRDRAPSQTFTDELLAWLYETYPNMDFGQFDRDGNGHFDAVILLNAGSVGDGIQIISFGGGFTNMYTYTGEYVGTPDRPTFNCFVNMNAQLFETNTLIHEFGHNLGLIDYYDVTYSGIDAVGRFDMQSGNYGDWNVYSKYAVGWLEPKTVTGLGKGESTEITIGASALTGDAIVIRGAESDEDDTPFDEYIMIDLFADAGVNVCDTERDGFALDGAVGVRIYHINAKMEKRELTVEGKDEVYPIGTVHIANNNTGNGRFNVELIQAGKDNTFTDLDNLRTMLSEKDLFKAGDSFTVESYGEFFDDGRMDDGTSFGYKIEIVNVTKGENPTATVRITRQ